MEQRIPRAVSGASGGVGPRPMPEEPRNHTWHWGTFVDGQSHGRLRPRLPLWRDTIVAITTGLLLGSSITFTALRGFWPPAGVLGGTFLLVHLVAIGLGQTVDETRLTRSDLLRIAATGAAAILLGALVALVAMV